MKVQEAIETTEDLGAELKKISADLRSGAIPHDMARQLILAVKHRGDLLRIEMAAASLGQSFQPIALKAEHRNGRPALKRVA